MVSTVRPRANEIDKIFAHKKYVEGIGASTISENTKEVVQEAVKTKDDLIKDAGYKSLKEYDPTKLLASYNNEPMEEYVSKFLVEDYRFSLHDAYNVNLTKFIELDFAYRWANNGDIALNIRGRGGKGKSNIALYLAMLWSYITKVPFKLSNMSYNLPEFNAMLKSMKFRDTPDGVRIEDFELEKGMCLCLDEASDTMRSGHLSATIQTQTESIEQRMRALQVARLCAGVGEVLHSAYYAIYAIKRDPKEKMCYGVVYTHESTSKDSPVMWLGYVKIPYVPLEIFEKYNKVKMKSIYDFAHGGGANRIAQLIDCFAKELWENRKYQTLPIRPPDLRINYLTMNQRYNIFTTISYFNQLERLTRNAVLNKELAENPLDDDEPATETI